MMNANNLITELVPTRGEENVFLVPNIDVHSATSAEPDYHGGKRGDLLGVLHRDVLIQEVSIASTDTPLFNLLGADFDPFRLWLEDARVAQYLSAFQYTRFGLVITVKLIVPGSAYGLYNVQALCEGGDSGVKRAVVGAHEIDSATFDNYPTSTQDVHAFMDVAEANVVTLTLPWVNRVDMTTTIAANSDTNCWRLLIWALSPITSTISNSNIVGKLQIFARAEKGIEVFNLIGQAGADEFEVTSKDKPSSHSLNTPVPAVQPASSSTSVNPSELKPSAVMGAVGKVAGALSSIPTLAPFTAPIGMAANTASRVLDMLGFTKDSDPRPPQPVRLTLASTMSNVDAPDTSEMVAFSQYNALTLDAASRGGDSDDPMSYASLFARWTIIDVFTITTEASGVIVSYPVTPFYSNSILGVRYFPVAGYVGQPFTYWRGGMEYEIYVPSSSNLQGALQVFWMPDPLATPPIDKTEVTNNFTNVVIDLKGSSQTCLKIGYSHPLPALFHSNYNNGSPFFFPSSVNGKLVFQMLAPLTAPRTDTSYNLKVIVKARAMPDMQFFGYSYIRPQANAESFSFQSLTFQSEAKNVVEMVPSKQYPVAELLAGESVTSVRALIQRYSECDYSDGKGDGVLTNMWILPHVYPPNNLVAAPLSTTSKFNPAGGGAPNSASNTPLSYYLPMFTGWFGSVRYKLYTPAPVGDQATRPTMIAGSPLPAYCSDIKDTATKDLARPSMFINPTGLEIMPVNEVTGAEMTMPYYTNMKYNLSRDFWDIELLTTAGGLGVRYNLFQPVLTPTSATPTPQVVVFTAAGPDFGVNRFRRTPGLIGIL